MLERGQQCRCQLGRRSWRPGMVSGGGRHDSPGRWSWLCKGRVIEVALTPPCPPRAQRPCYVITHAHAPVSSVPLTCFTSSVNLVLVILTRTGPRYYGHGCVVPLYTGCTILQQANANVETLDCTSVYNFAAGNTDFLCWLQKITPLYRDRNTSSLNEL